MKILSMQDYAIISGGVLTDKQVESLTAKAGGYLAKGSFLGLLTLAKVLPLHAFLIGGVAGPIASLVGTYLVYENKEYVLGLVTQTQNALPSIY